MNLTTPNFKFCPYCRSWQPYATGKHTVSRSTGHQTKMWKCFNCLKKPQRQFNS